MRISRIFSVLLLLAGVGCAAQSKPSDSGLQARLDRQIKLTIRSQYNVPPDFTVTLGKRTKSDISGYDSLPVTFSQNGARKKTTNFLISKDGNTLARLEKFDLTRNPATNILTLGRPVRGNSKAKVTIVNFDDLECPFCARMHEELFPATEQHYGNQVRFIYMDFPLLQLHPWAMHAAVDVECLANQSQPGYWNLVDYIHGHDAEISGPEGKQNVGASTRKLDDLTRAEGQREKVDMSKLNSCIAKQDESSVRAAMKQGDALGIDGTPTLFVNGERATGAIPQSVLWTIIDRAIRDAGGTPPSQVNGKPANPAAASGN